MVSSSHTCRGIGLLGGKDQTQFTAHFLQPGEPWQECPGPQSEGLVLCVWDDNNSPGDHTAWAKETEVGMGQTAHALRCTEPCVFKGLKELFPYVPFGGGGMLFKQKLAAAVSAFSARDIIHLWVNSPFVSAMFALSPQREKMKTHGHSADELA